MAPGVMLLDMLKLRRLPKRRNIPIQVPNPLMQSREPAPNVANVAFEVLHVNGIEANYGRVKTDVCFCYGGAEVVGGGMGGEVGFCAGKGVEERVYGFFIGFLCAVLALVIRWDMMGIGVGRRGLT